MRWVVVGAIISHLISIGIFCGLVKRVRYIFSWPGAITRLVYFGGKNPPEQTDTSVRRASRMPTDAMRPARTRHGWHARLKAASCRYSSWNVNNWRGAQRIHYDRPKAWTIRIISYTIPRLYRPGAFPGIQEFKLLSNYRLPLIFLIGLSAVVLLKCALHISDE